jgi:hypothetical protein
MNVPVQERIKTLMVNMELLAFSLFDQKAYMVNILYAHLL